ncbi:Lipoprotein [Bibersteinia trehalosi USDA-ARS-USMARC-189]|uniref:Lipoprotein n=2 Tax=Bibersteinia trehalosi TaxID=47735 RepID=W0R979_BIBTR|nr:hypothetical protein [Bibersteinia trehalosi]AHG83073.1 Lipoprotein [Bibersteinia trehalosi USDA-ARS-USMARC-189]AHG87341.1 Lipoprotein [Bibersteinia trehalosi USDA-ARS-USMARC-190]
MKKLVLVGFVSALLAGCTGTVFKPIDYTMKSKFNASQAEKQLKQGTANITGSAFLKQRGGSVVTCAGEEVVLVPYTDYANEKMSLIYGNTEKGFHNSKSTQYKLSGEDPEYRKFVKFTTCDAQGKFSFNNLADGTFFITTKVQWSVHYQNSEGGYLMQKVSLKKGENKDIVLSY